jgi:hypothetical protein
VDTTDNSAGDDDEDDDSSVPLTDAPPLQDVESFGNRVQDAAPVLSSSSSSTKMLRSTSVMTSLFQKAADVASTTNTAAASSFLFGASPVNSSPSDDIDNHLGNPHNKIVAQEVEEAQGESSAASHQQHAAHKQQQPCKSSLSYLTSVICGDSDGEHHQQQQPRHQQQLHRNNQPAIGVIANRRSNAISNVALSSHQQQQGVHPQDHEQTSISSQQLHVQLQSQSGKSSFSCLTSFIYGDGGGDQLKQHHQPQASLDGFCHAYPSLVAILPSELDAIKRDILREHDNNELDQLFVDRDKNKSAAAAPAAANDDNTDSDNSNGSSDSDEDGSILMNNFCPRDEFRGTQPRSGRLHSSASSDKDDNTDSDDSNSSSDGDEDGSMVMNNFCPRDEFRGTQPRSGRRHSSQSPEPATYNYHGTTLEHSNPNPANPNPNQKLQPEVHDHVQAAADVQRPMPCFVASPYPAYSTSKTGSPASAPASAPSPPRNPVAAALAALPYSTPVRQTRTPSLNNDHHSDRYPNNKISDHQMGQLHKPLAQIRNNEILRTKEMATLGAQKEHERQDAAELREMELEHKAAAQRQEEERRQQEEHMQLQTKLLVAERAQLRHALTLLQNKYNSALLVKKSNSKEQDKNEQSESVLKDQNTQQHQQKLHRHAKKMEDLQSKYPTELDDLQSKYDDCAIQHYDQVTYLELQMTDERQASHAAQDTLVDQCQEELSQMQNRLEKQEETYMLEQEEHYAQVEDLQRQLEVTLQLQESQEQRVIEENNQKQEHEQQLEATIENLLEQLQLQRESFDAALDIFTEQFTAEKRELQRQMLELQQEHKREVRFSVNSTRAQEEENEEEDEIIAEAFEEEHVHIQQQLQRKLETHMQMCRQLRQHHAQEVLYLETQLEHRKTSVAALPISKREQEEFALNDAEVESIAFLKEQNDAQTQTINFMASHMKEKDGMIELLEAQLDEESAVRDNETKERSLEESHTKKQLTNIKRQFKRHLSINSGVPVSSAAPASELAALEATSILKTELAKLQMQLQVQAQVTDGDLSTFQEQLQKQHGAYYDELASLTRYVDCLKAQLRQRVKTMPNASRDPDANNHRMMFSTGKKPSSWPLERRQRVVDVSFPRQASAVAVTKTTVSKSLLTQRKKTLDVNSDAVPSTPLPPSLSAKQRLSGWLLRDPHVGNKVQGGAGVVEEDEYDCHDNPGADISIMSIDSFSLHSNNNHRNNNPSPVYNGNIGTNRRRSISSHEQGTCTSQSQAINRSHSCADLAAGGGAKLEVSDGSVLGFSFASLNELSNFSVL